MLKWILNWIKKLSKKEKKDRFEKLKKDMAEGYLSKAEEKSIDKLEKEFKEMKSKLEKHPLEKKYNNKYPKIPILYMGRHVPNSSDRVPIDVRCFIDPHSEQINQIVKQLDLKNKTDDEKALECLRWVISNIKYVSDRNKGHNEFWQFAHETLYYMTGDCEDGSILLANLMEAAGVDYWRIRLTAGYVKTRGGKGGHVYLVYYCESKEKWVVLDWCYYPNFKRIEKRPEYKKEGRYLDVWFSWSSKYSFSKGLNKKAESFVNG